MMHMKYEIKFNENLLLIYFRYSWKVDIYFTNLLIWLNYIDNAYNKYNKMYLEVKLFKVFWINNSPQPSAQDGEKNLNNLWIV